MKLLTPLRLALIVLTLAVATSALLLMPTTQQAQAHCQIPCGIYDDATQFKVLALHITTIEKSMREITTLSAKPGKNANQLIRWVNNKEAHGDGFAAIITAYFLQQRIKPPADENELARKAYIKKLVLCHKLLIGAMKAKQTTDPAAATSLRTLLAEFQAVYNKKS